MSSLASSCTTPLKALLAGTHAALVHETRVRIRSVNNLLESFDVQPSTAKDIARLVAYCSWFGLATSLVCACLIPPFGSALPLQTGDVTLLIMLASLFAAVCAIHMEAKQQRKHHSFLELLSPLGRCGFTIGNQLLMVPVIVFTLKQAVFLGTAVTFSIALLYATLVVTITIVQPYFNRVRLYRYLAPTVTIVALVVTLPFITYYLLANTSLSSIRVIKIYDYTLFDFTLFTADTQRFAALHLLIACLISVAVAWATYMVAICLAKHRFAPRNTTLHRNLGVATGLSLLAAWIAAFTLALNTRFASLSGFTVVLGVIIALTILRIRGTHYVNPESLGMNLLLLRDTHASGECIVRFYRFNWIVFSLPTLVAGLALLIVRGNMLEALVLVSLYIVEIALEEIIVQRRTTILPASSLNMLSSVSRSGIGCAVIATISFSPLSISVVVPSLHFERNSTAVCIASLLFIAVAGILMWVRFLDMHKWLPSVFCKPGVTVSND